MKRYRKFERWLADVDKCLDHPAQTVDESPLSSLAYSFSGVYDQLPRDVERVKELIAVLKKLREAKGAGRGVFEERVMQGLSYLAMTVCAELRHSGLKRLPLSAMPDTLSPEQRPPFVFLQELCRYAIDCLAFSRSRDSLAGQRRCSALKILTNALDMFEPPDSVLDTVRGILKNGRGNDVRGALLFCEAYYGAQPDGVPKGMEALLLRLVGKTDSRGLAAGALNVLVESGNISEFLALDYIDDWKQRNYKGFGYG